MIQIKTTEHLLNEKIKNKEVRIAGGELISLEEALRRAYELDADLIQVSESNNVSICVIELYDKFLYNKRKAEKNKNKKTSKGGLKEIKLGLSIGEHDLSHKSKKAIEFVNNGYKVKVSIVLRGREINRENDAKDIIDRFTSLCNLSYDNAQRREGSTIYAIIKK